ncbi:NAD(P)-dependent oxidoreductase [Streptomyces niveiscabiei]|uniref:NAD(P)-dependent oxidoreductase n=1 Tax=Streptomyces niveiscabiei TaxID=164115 RepID=A0ABW9I635_9ACTN
MESPERARLDAYFRRVTDRFPAADGTSTLVVTHLLPERPAFLRALARTTTVAAVLPKPKSADPTVLAATRTLHAVHDLSREHFSDPGHVLGLLEDTVPGEQVVLLDIGGYFAPALHTLTEKFSGRIRGVVEDTENGHQRYQALPALPCPVFSAARSPLKDCEDHLVGRSIVFSAEALIRDRGDILTNHTATVIGFGKIGRAIAHTLRAHDLHTTVHDTDPVRQIQARALGHRTTTRLTDALHDAGLVLCATGNIALRHQDFTALRNGTYVASATSPDDEFELGPLQNNYHRTPITPRLTRYETTGHYFYVLADGEAVNFVHGASVGTYIHLVQAELLAATALLTHTDPAPGLHELPPADRHTIAELWLDHFSR